MMGGDDREYGDQEDVIDLLNGDISEKVCIKFRAFFTLFFEVFFPIFNYFQLLQAYADEDDDFDLEDEDDFEVKTDQIDEVIFFCEAFSGMRVNCENLRSFLK